jgi:hypothetical protein
MAMEPRPNTGLPHVTPEPTAVEARQGVISGRVLAVLVTSILLGVLALAISFFVVH